MDLSQVPTYRAGIAQSKAHRALSVMVTRLLKKHDISMLQWFILGLVHDAGKRGIRITDIAIELDTTKAFVTKNINLLEAKQLVSRSIGTKDTRSRIVILTPQARPLAVKIEHELRSDMRANIYQDVQPDELATYVKVLTHLSKLS